MRASFSGAAFCQASLVETQQAFLELHVEAFEWFGGVVRAGPLRQPELGGQAGPQGPPARGDRPLRRAALALPVRVAVHHAGHAGRAREGRRRGRGRALPPQPPRPGPGGRRPGRAQRAAAGRLRGGPAPADRRPRPRRSARRGRPSGRCCARCPASRSTRPRPRRRASTPSRWSRSARTATRSRSRWPG